MVNRNSIPINPELPKVLGNEQMHVYAPLVDDENPGMARFDEEFFDVVEDAVGLVRLSATLIKKLEYMHKSISASGATDLENGRNPELPSAYIDLMHAANDLYNQVVNLSSVAGNHEGRIVKLEVAEQEIRDDITNLETKIDNDITNLERGIRYDITNLESDVGKTDLETIAKNLKGAVNEVNAIAKRAKEHANTNETQLISINAQLQGVGRSYAIEDFNVFLNFINGSTTLPIYEDRNGDGVDEQYVVSVADLKTGDNILLAENEVPDFWFEKTQESSDKTYEYNGVEHILNAYFNGVLVGVLHILETDYQVIVGHAMSAGQSAANAAASALEAKETEANIDKMVDELYFNQIAPPYYELENSVFLVTPTYEML